VDTPGDPALFWTTLTVTLAGALLTLAATAVLARRAVRARRDLRARIAAGKAASDEHLATLLRVGEEERAAQALRLSGVFTTDAPPAEDRLSERRLAAQATFEAEFLAGVGRPSTDAKYIDNLLMPELIELAITEDQIDELTLPAALVALGVLTSTVGSVLSLFV
jgi:hypothetical protein